MTWSDDVRAGRASLEEVGGLIRGEPRGVALMRYQQRLALEQQETARRKLMRERYDAAAAGRKIL